MLLNMDVLGFFRSAKQFGFFLAVFGSAFSNSFCGIGLGTYAGAALLETLFCRGVARPAFPFPSLVVALALSLLVSVFISHYFWVSLQGFGKYLQTFLIFYAAQDVLRTERDLMGLLVVFLAAYWLAGASGVYQEIFGADFLRGRTANIYMGDIKRLTGSFKNCNDYGTFLMPGFAIVVAAIFGAPPKRKLIFVGANAVLLAVLSYVLMRSLSRSAILSLFVALFFFSFFFRAWRVAVPSLAAVMALLWVIPSSLSERLHEIPSWTGGDMGERFLLIRTTLKMIAVNPLFGLGVNTYSDYFPQFKPADYPAAMYSHNTYLQMASEIGWIGVTLYFALIVLAGFSAWRALRKAPRGLPRWFGAALLVGAVGFLFNCLFESALQSTQLRTLFWALLGSAYAVAKNILPSDITMSRDRADIPKRR